MKITKAYKFRIYPNKEQQEFLIKTFGCVRKMHNLMLDDRIKKYEEFKINNCTTNNKCLTPAEIKKENKYMYDVDSLALTNVYLTLNKAYINFFKNKTNFKYPKFKSKKNSRQSYTTYNQGGTVTIIDNKLIKLPKLNQPIKIKVHRIFPDSIKIRSATVVYNSSKKFYVSIICETDTESFINTGKNIGIDVGIKNFITLSSGIVIDNPKFKTKSQKRLTKEQRKLSKKLNKIIKNKELSINDCKNYQKQKIKVAKIHEKIKNQKNDFLNKLSTDIIKNHDTICTENLDIKNMLKNRKLSKEISNVSWNIFIKMLEYKSNWYGKNLIKIGRWFPSSQICSKCKYKSGKKTLDIRVWRCPVCGKNHDRDVNASINILNEGLRLHQLQQLPKII